MIKEAISQLVKRKDLLISEMELVMEEIMTGKASPAQIASFLTALRMKGETIDEIVGAANIMRNHVTRIKTNRDLVLDTCGTGGDESFTFNISTICAFVVSGAGIPVAKHGNRSVSSRCGSADLLSALGVNIEAEENIVSECIDKIGIGFLFAPALHKAMHFAVAPRREIGIRTVFNILGPMTNPAGARHQLIGVYGKELTEPIAKALGRLGSKHALIVHGEDGLDEVTTTGYTQISELKDAKVGTFMISPEDFGIKRASADDLKGGDCDYNAKIALEILGGNKGSRRDVVILNAACAIYAADRTSDIGEAVKLAEDAIVSGAALLKLEQLKELTNR
ncbi:MAG: anthranilate phosphoribosyltransferase [Candidatus Omnitrophota bacterium]